MKPILCSRVFTAGDVVFDCKPLIHVIANEHKGKHCDNCSEPLVDELKVICQRCEQMSYCCPQCKRDDEKYHIFECQVFANPNYELELSQWQERLLLRLWLCVLNDDSFARRRYLTISGSYVSLNDIHFKNRSDLNFIKDFDYICEHFMFYGVIVNRRRLLHWFTLLSIDNRYVFGFLHYDLNPFEFDLCRAPVAYGLHIQLSVLRHSCLPNTTLINNGLSMVLRAMESIGVDEEITITYIELNHNYNERQDQLRRNYWFNCRCLKCEGMDDFDYNGLKELLSHESYHWSIKTELDPLFNHMQNFSQNYAINSRLISLLRQIYGKNHRFITGVLVVSFISFVLYSNESNNWSNDYWYREVEASLLVTHGSDHPLYEMLMVFVMTKQILAHND